MNSIRHRLTIGLGAAFCVLWCVGAVGLFLVVRAGLLAEFDNALKASAEALAALTSQEGGQVEFDFTPALMPAFRDAPNTDYFQLWLPDGSTRDRSPSLKDHDLPRRAGALDSPELWNVVLPDGRSGRAIGIHFVAQQDIEAPAPSSPPSVRGEVTLVVARHRGELDHRLNLLGTALLLVGAAMAVATRLVVTIAVRQGLQPLSELTERAAGIDASSLQLRFPTESMPAELLPIAARLNDLLARLEAAFGRERRFSADVAHELRTPIAELRALAEVALKWPDDVQATRSGLQDALAIALQMESITTGLLVIARCEGGQLPVRPEPVPLASLIKELLQPLAHEASTKQLSLSLDVPEDACWLTDPALLRAILTNLLSNAVEYSPAGGAIRLRVGRSGGCGQLMISNTADDLNSDDLPHMFDRFWRKDPARSATLHCGLGLALTKALAESLGMDLHSELAGRGEITLALSSAQICACPNGAGT